MVDVPAIRPEVEPPGELSGDEPVEEVAHAGAVREAGECRVVPPQTEAAVERDRHQEAGLALAESERLEGVDALVEGHHSRSRCRGSKGVPPRWLRPPRPPAPAAR